MHSGVRLAGVAVSLIAGFFVLSLFSCVNVVYDASQLLAILNSLTYKEWGNYTIGGLPISDDIHIVGTVTISSELLEVPEECKNREDCRHLVAFKNNYGADDISLPSEFSLTLTNVTVRFRALLVDTHPSEFNLTPMIHVMPPSYHQCDDSQTKCEIDQVCYNNWFWYCKDCLTLTPDKCVCRDEDGIFADGTDCRFAISDIEMRGTCQAGECEVNSDFWQFFRAE
jgi:hypothetical protein